MTTTPPGSDPTATPAATPSDRLWLRSELMGTQVITRDTGRRLGVVGEVVVIKSHPLRIYEEEAQPATPVADVDVVIHKLKKKMLLAQDGIIITEVRA
jgi:hypothetical protein